MTGALIWILVAFMPDSRMDFVSAHPAGERVCRQEALRKAAESKRYLKQPLAFACIQSTPIQGLR